MTTRVDALVNHWAVLVGINFYVQDRHLQGSVRDVEMVNQYLNGGPTPVDTVILTATSPTPCDPSSSCPIEEPDSWPTYSNVVSALLRVIERAKPGDSVYIHFSGHGTRIKRLPVGPLKSSDQLALVLFEEDGCSYLKGEHLATALQDMVSKGLFVTLVLDCCFSGTPVRHNNSYGVGIRATDYRPASDVERLQEPQESSTGPLSTLRNAHIVPEWLEKPKGYSILSACGPHEVASELTDDQGSRRGALSYFLIDALSTLRKRGAELTHQSLYQYLRTVFHASWPQQTPMRYGNGKVSFLGNAGVVYDTTLLSLYRALDNRLCLNGGEAHGVCKGDEYAAYPFHVRESMQDQMKEAPIVVKVGTLRCLTADLSEIKPPSAANTIETGWKARPLTSLSLWKMSVQLMASLGNPAPWMEAGNQQRFLRLSTEDAGPESYIFNLTLNENKEYEILDGWGKSVTSLPTITANTEGALNFVMTVLQHLAKFKYFEVVKNRASNLTWERSFSLLPFDDNRASGGCDVEHGSEWGFTFSNLSDRPLYLTVFNCTPSWQIINLVSSAGGGDFLVLQPKKEGNKSKQEIRLRMEVPDFLQDRGVTECEDTIKVFITSKPTSFSSAILPEMPLQAGIQRGKASESDDQLSRFLSELIGGSRGQGDISQEGWATRDFTIRTTVRESQRSE